MKKRVLTMAMALCMLLSLLPFGASAAEIVKSGSCGKNVTYTLDSDGVLTISGTGEMFDYREFGDGKSPFYNLVRIKTVIIEPGVTSIGDNAFNSCTYLTSITIPDSVTSIGQSAFYFCTDLKSVSIPDGVTRIEFRTFRSCHNLKSVTIPDSVMSIECAAFGECSNLTSVTIPDSVMSIECAAFEECSNLTSVTIPDSVTSIGEQAFRGCKSLTSIEIPDGVTSIEYDSFNGCTSLTSVTIPDSVTSISVSAFKYCTSLTDITLPDSVTKICDSAFYGCSSLESINIPERVNYINWYAFTGCTSLTTLRMSSNIQEIQQSAFYGADNLKDVYYCGTEDEWNAITIQDYNEPLKNATIHFDAHALTEILGEDATCTADGVQTCWKCDYCDKLFSDAEGKHAIEAPAVIPSLGHDWSEWEVMKPATATAEGEETHTCSRCGETETRTIPKLANPFVDVTEDAFYYEPVIWAVYHDPAITVGTDATHFSPDATCTRAQAVTFLWRAMDRPEPKTTESPFTDVSEGDWYYKPVLWAAENGITGGVGGGRFDPNGVCNRSQIVAFLWRATRPHEAPSAGSAFTDVPAGTWFTEPVAWAVEKGITYGIGNGQFGPFLDCTRGQIVTFLYRCMK